jgi:uncharacterized membrane protein YeaQ/YmgE (transglycosylase-associated protein family)
MREIFYVRELPIKRSGNGTGRANGSGNINLEVSMWLLWALFIGLIVGAVAKAIMPGRDGGGMVVTALLGIVGAIVAAFLGQQLGWYAEGEPAGFLAAVVGALIVLSLYRLVAKRA